MAYSSCHCFDIDNIIPPTKAAQLETPAKNPNPKKAKKEDFELTLRIPATPNLFKNKKPMIIKRAILKATSVGLTLFLAPKLSIVFTLLKSFNLSKKV